MAAADHLSGEQFITSTHLQSLRSNDFPSFKVGQLHGGKLPRRKKFE